MLQQALVLVLLAPLRLLVLVGPWYCAPLRCRWIRPRLTSAGVS